MSKSEILKIAANVLALCLGGTFVFSGFSKVQYPFDFLGDVYAYEIVSARLGVILAATIPWLEIVLGFCLLSGTLIGGAALLAAIMSAGFFVAQIIVMYRGMAIPCGCFAVGIAGEGELVGGLSIVRTAIIALLSLGMAYHSVRAMRGS